MTEQAEQRFAELHGVRTLARGLFWLVLAFIAGATLSPIELRPETGLPAFVERLGAFAVVGALSMVAYPRYRFRCFWSLILVAAGLEAGQHLVAGRHGRFIDFDVKAVGTLAGCCAVLAAERIGWALGILRRP